MTAMKFTNPNVVSVGEGEVGYLSGKSNEQNKDASLEVDVDNPGYAVGLRNSDTGSVALIHPDGSPVDILSAFRKLRRRGGNFNEGTIIAKESSRVLGWITAYLKKRIEKIKVVNPRGSKGLGVDEGGFYFPTNPEAGIGKDDLDDLEMVEKIKS